MVIPGRYSKPMVAVTAAIAIIFGFAIAFFDLSADSVLFWIGAAVVGVLFVVFLLIPFLRGLMRQGRES